MATTSIFPGNSGHTMTMLSIIKSYYSPQKVESAPAPVAVEAWFPTEILLLIIFHLGSFSRRSLRSLLYVSRDAYQLTLPILYRDLVFLKDPSNPGDFRHRLESLDATLSAQSHLATYARSVHIHVQDVGTDPLIEKVLTRLVNLEALAVNINEHSFLLRSLPKFEHLRCFVTRGAWNEEQMVGFLRRQDTLEAIDLGFHCPWGRGSPYPTSNMLPQLRSIVCKGDMWPNLAGRDQLEHLSGSMYNFNRSHDAINRSSSMFSNLRSMSALEIDQRTFERIAPLLSKVEYLDIQLRFYTFEPMEVLSHIPSQSLRYVRFKLDSPYSPQVDFVDEIFRAFPALVLVDIYGSLSQTLYENNACAYERYSRGSRTPSKWSFPYPVIWEQWWEPISKLIEGIPVETRINGEELLPAASNVLVDTSDV